MTEVMIRDAATVVLLRQDGGPPRVLMGQRGASAAFMPGKFVFPGGGIDATDAVVPLASGLNATCRRRLADAGPSPERASPERASPESIAVAGIRELWEEAGLILGTAAAWPDPPDDWQGFAAQGYRPDAGALHYIFRAITPPGSPRRFDARFFLADAAQVAGDPDDFSRASDELRYLQWIPLAETRDFDLPFVTEIVLAEVNAMLDLKGPVASVPFFDNSGELPQFRRLR